MPVLAAAGSNSALLCASWYDPPQDAIVTLPSARADVAMRPAASESPSVFFISFPPLFQNVCRWWQPLLRRYFEPGQRGEHRPDCLIMQSVAPFHTASGRASDTMPPPAAGTMGAQCKGDVSER